MTYSLATQIVLKLGEAEALHLESTRLDLEHLLIGLLKVSDLRSRPPDITEQDWAAVTAERDRLLAHLKAANATPTMMRRRLRYLVKNGPTPSGAYTGARTEGAEGALRRAEQLAGSDPVDLLDLLAGCLEQPSALRDQLFEEYSVRPSVLMPGPNGDGSGTADTVQREHRSGSGGQPDRAPTARAHQSPLAGYGRDLTAMARAGELLPVVGRREDMKQLARVLGEKLRPNAVLVGDPGVGKTAIVEGLAQYAAGDDAHDAVRDYHFVEIPAGTLVANHGTVLFEVLAHAKNDPNLVLFVDEFHTLVRMGAADVLKPPLGRGELHLIGATTTEEYHKYVEPEEALSRRLFPLWVDEASRDETLEILRGIRPTLQAHHDLTIADDVLTAAVDLTSRFMSEGHMPDKALTVLDQACSRHRLKTFTPGAVSPELQVDDVGEVLAARTGIPADVILMKEDERWLVLEQMLAARVVGQDEAVTAVAESMRQSRAGLRPAHQPPVFLFAGPSGTGKTELAKALSAALFLTEDRLVRVDMTDYREPHQVSRLLGSPYGYVGSDETPPLVRDILRRPYSVVLLDEVEKAHPDVLQVFLPVFDEGYLSTAKGKRVDFSHAVFVLTSNLGSGGVGLGLGSEEFGFRRPGSDAEQPRQPVPAAGMKDQILDAIVAHFSAEFLGRVRRNGRVVVFQPLSQQSVFAILELQLADINRREGLAGRGLDLVLDDSAKAFLMQRGYSPRYGARDLQGAVQTWVANPLSRALLAGDFTRPGQLLCRADGDALAFDYQPEGDPVRTFALAPRVDPLATL